MRKLTDEEVFENFWKRVTKSDKCWEWERLETDRGIRGNNRYGEIFFHGKTVSTNRMSWIIEYGDIPDGMFVCHSCDNKKCVRPDHLYLGSNSTNIRDAYNRGKESPQLGEENGRHKLTTNQVLEIKKRILSGEPATKISIDYDVVPRTIRQIRLGKTWSHVKL